MYFSSLCTFQIITLMPYNFCPKIACCLRLLHIFLTKFYHGSKRYETYGRSLIWVRIVYNIGLPKELSRRESRRLKSRLAGNG